MISVLKQVILVVVCFMAVCNAMIGNAWMKNYIIKQIEQNLEELKNLKFKSTQQNAGTSATTYVRWGRTKCAGDATLVYDGFMAGKHFGVGGSGANVLCLPKDPEWKRYASGQNSATAKIYGLEMDVLHSAQAFGTSVLNKDMPCAVCKTAGRSAVLMIPGKYTCHKGWHKEFSGYLVAQNHDNKRTAQEYICADENLESIPGGDADDNEAVLYPVEIGSCKTLKCPPYQDGRELTCVVCSQ